MKIRIENRKCFISEIQPNEMSWLNDNFTYFDKYQEVPVEAFWKSPLKENEYYGASGLALIIQEKAKDLKEYISVEIDDTYNSLQREQDFDLIEKVTPDILENITLRDYQVSAVRKALLWKEGLIESPVGSGKTEIILAILKILISVGRISSAVLVAPDIFLVNQLYERAISRGFEPQSIGVVQGRREEFGRIITIGTIDSLSLKYNKGDKRAKDCIENCDFILWDESHHLSSETNRNLLLNCNNAEYALGVTATPYSGNNSIESINDLILLSLVKRTIFKLEQSFLVDKGYVARPIVKFVKIPGYVKYQAGYNTLYKRFIINNKFRNEQIRKYSLLFHKYGLQTLIIVTQKEHAHVLLKLINRSDCVAMFGGEQLSVFEEGVIDVRRCGYESFVRMFENRQLNIIIATQLFDEGIDLPNIGAYINAAGGKSYKKTVQRLGRSLRLKGGLNEAYVVDFCDKMHPIFFNHYKERRETYLDKGARIYEDEYEFIRRVHENYELSTENQGNEAG